MFENLIFLGAGASLTEGAPLQADLFRDYFKDFPTDIDRDRYLDVADMYEERLEELLHEDPFKTLANTAAWNCLGFVIGLDNKKAMKELELGDQEKREEADKFFHIIEGECYGILRELSASIDYTLDDCRIQRAD